MMQAKLTLSIDPAVVVRAKRYAKRTGMSVSQLVETYLDTVTRKAAETPDTPVLNSLRGALKGVDPDAYRKISGEKVSGMKVLQDSNVILDMLLERQQNFGFSKAR
jgi:hypothetical protein